MTLTINNKLIEISQSWNELPLKKQLMAYAILMTDTGDLLESKELIPAKRILLMKMLLEVNDAFMEKWKQDCLTEYGAEDGLTIFHSELEAVLDCTNFLFDIQKIEGEDPLEYVYQYTMAFT